jgi:2-octaprenyl-6-methoxyphenol hydroxylase
MAQPVRDGDTVEAAVVGGGPAGLTAAIALAQAGVETALIAPPHAGDNRTTALLAASVNALTALGVWAHCAEAAAPLAAIRIVDDRGGLLHAPETMFRAEEIGLPAFGFSIANRDLMAGLGARAGELAGLRTIADAASRIDIAENSATVSLANGRRLRAALLIGADGRNSLCRRAAGIAVRDWTYRQTALTCNLEHARAHADISTEFHTASGPFTLVPITGTRSGLVWVVRPDEAERLLALDDAAFAMAVERQSHSMLGQMRLVSERTSFPLSGQTAEHVAGERVALVGEAAHVMPPIGAQGFNLGLRDAATLAELVADANRRGEDIGSSELLGGYESRRRIDVASRTAAVDLLNRSLLSDFLPAQALRGAGLYLLDRIGPLRRAVMREGVASRFDAPRLMRGEPL